MPERRAASILCSKRLLVAYQRDAGRSVAFVGESGVTTEYDFRIDAAAGEWRTPAFGVSVSGRAEPWPCDHLPEFTQKSPTAGRVSDLPAQTALEPV